MTHTQGDLLAVRSIRRAVSRILSTTALTAAGLALFAIPSKADNWGDHTYDEGNVDVDVSIPDVTNLHQTTDFVKARGDGDITAGHTVNLNQPGSGSMYVLYDIENDPALIQGALNANGQVFIFDQDGTIFGADSRVNVGSIVTSTGHISDADLRDGDGHYTFEGVDTGGSIEMRGTITVADAGLAAFVAPTVRNSGVINARLGKVAMAAGSRVTLDLYGDGLVEIAASDKVNAALLENSGTINAEGGVVAMRAEDAREMANNVINMSGVINASSATVSGGKIILGGGHNGNVNVSGTLNAYGTEGGSITVTGHDVIVEQSGLFNTGGGAGDDGEGDAGDIYIYADNNAIFRGRAFAQGGPLGGNGGFVEISAANEAGYDGSVNTLALNGTSGSFLIDPLFAVIHSGVLNTYPGGGNFLSARALANDLAQNAIVTVQATNYIDVGTNTAGPGVGTGNIDVSTGTQTTYVADNPGNPGLVNACAGPAGPSNPHCIPTSVSALAHGNLTLQASLVNFIKDLTMGDGTLTVNAGTLNLNSRIYGRNSIGGPAVLLGDSKLIGTGILSTINVQSPSALINQGISFSDDATNLTTVNVGAGIYDETVQIVGANKSNLWLKGAGQGLTFIKPTTMAGAPALANGFPWNGQLYTPIVLAQGANNVDVSGLTIDGTLIGGNISGTNTSGLTYYNAGGDATDVTITNAGAFGFYAAADGTQGHTGRLVTANNITSSGNWWAALAAIGNQLNLNITGGNYNGAGASDALDLSNGSQGTVTGATLSTGTHSDQAGISFHGGHDWSINNVTINGGGAGTTGIADDGPAYGVSSANNISITGGTISNVGTGIDAIGGHNWDVNGTMISSAAAGGGKGVHFAGLTGGNVNTINGVNVSGFAQGIHNNGSNGTQITGGTFTNNTTGILVNPSSNVVIDGVNTNGGTNGVVFTGGDNNTVKNSFVNNTVGDGVVVNGSTTAKVLHNQIGLLGGANSIGSGAGGGDAIFVTNSDGTVITGNFTANTHYDGPLRKGSGILVTNSDNVQIGGAGALGNDISLAGSDGIVIRTDGGTADNNTIEGNTIHGVAGSRTGIYTEFATNTDIINNIVSGSGRYAAIYGNGGSNFNISGNTLDHNDEIGILLQNAGGTNLIDDNTIDNTGENKKASDGTNSGDGIRVLSSSGVTVSNNKVGLNGGTNNIKGNGVTIMSSPSTTVSANSISNTMDNGIFLNPSANSIVQNNTLKVIGQNGIYLSAGNHRVQVLSNQLHGVMLDGVFATGSNDIEIKNNEIRASTLVMGAGGHGINVVGGTSALIEDNLIQGGDGLNGVPGKKGVGGDGIHVNNNDGVEIIDNTIKGGARAPSGGSNGDGGSGAGGHGIYVTESQQAFLKDNDVLSGNTTSSGRTGGQGADLAGIYAINNAGTNAFKNGIYIGFNVIDGNGSVDSAGDDGIFVQNSGHHSTGNKALIESNRVDFTGEDGIDVRGTNGVQIKNNTVTNVNEIGIRLNPSHDAVIDNNTINNTGIDGIQVLSSNNVDVTNNKLHTIGRHGIYGENSNSLDIVLNKIGTGSFGVSGAAEDGIHVTGGRNVKIDQNTVQGGSLGAGAGHDGIHVVNNREAVITNNIIKSGSFLSVGAGNDGIYVDNSGAQIGGGLDVIFGQIRDGVVITGNQVISSGLSLGAGHDGIHVISSPGGLVATPQATVGSNTIQGVGNDGIFVTNTDFVRVINNSVSLSGDDGIEIDESDFAETSGNTVTLSGDTGILIDPSNFTVTDGNTVSLSGGYGIWVDGGVVNTVSNNNVSLSGDDGIRVDNNNLSSILGNTVTLSGGDGVEVNGGNLNTVDDNTISLSSDNGVYFHDSALGQITDNTVTLSGDDGIDVENSLGVDVSGNTVTLSGDNGIEVSNVALASIDGNVVTFSGNNGVGLRNAAGASVDGNIVTLSGNHGIFVDPSIGISVDGNIVTLSGNDGIHVEDVLGLTVNGNIVTLSGNDGIDIDGVFGFSADGNVLTLSGDNGIELSNAALGLVNGNIVTLSGNDGINIQDAAFVGVDGNIVTLSGGDGIDLDDTLFSSVSGNIVTLSGDNGIEVSDALFADVNGNIVTLSGNDGINVHRTLFTDVNGNIVTLSGGDGIDLENSLFADINGNIVTLSADSGIEVEDSAFVDILGNITMFNAGAGIFVDPSSNILVDGNVSMFNVFGIQFLDVTDSTISNNLVANNLIAGVDLENVGDVYILDNNISDNGVHGLHSHGRGNGLIVLQGNSFTDNPTGALFQHSGQIDISDLTNPNSFTSTDPLATPVGMMFDGPANALTIVGETLGATEFTGFGNIGSYYVYFTDGSILDPITGNPIVIDGMNANFDGIVPASVGGFLTSAQRTFIEDRLFDADDLALNGRGQIFIGFDPFSVAQEDIFRNFDFPGLDISGLNITLLGLPSIPGGPAALNSIRTFAGGGGNSGDPNDLNSIETAAGGEGTSNPYDLNAIETAAGESEKAACWGDAMSAAVSGKAVSYSYTGDIEATLSGAASCGNVTSF
ncbi:MAG: right-handed parallel beta-helix repeat-containing protein [Alphaproteobacteria bacterium]